MASPKIFERTYIALKREVTSGKYAPGHRLQARSLADTLYASASPVTNAMRQLVGEDILEYSLMDSFTIPRVTERRLRDLYSWQSWILTACIEAADKVALPSDRSNAASSHEVCAATERLFAAIAELAGNGEFVRANANASDRLRTVRQLEIMAFPDHLDEVQGLGNLIDAGDRGVLRRIIGRYFRRRIEAAALLVSLSYQDKH